MGLFNKLGGCWEMGWEDLVFSTDSALFQITFNRIWPTAVAGEADRELTLSGSACHVGGPNSVNPGQILLVYGMLVCSTFMEV